jgi:hypothetical protein
MPYLVAPVAALIAMGSKRLPTVQRVNDCLLFLAVIQRFLLGLQAQQSKQM